MAQEAREKVVIPGTSLGEDAMMVQSLPKVARTIVFADRGEAGRRLAEEMSACRGQDELVLGIPRGVPAAADGDA